MKGCSQRRKGTDINGDEKYEECNNYCVYYYRYRYSMAWDDFHPNITIVVIIIHHYFFHSSIERRVKPVETRTVLPRVRVVVVRVL